MNWAKGLRYLGFLFAGVGLLVLTNLLGDEPEERMKLLMDFVIFPDPDLVSDTPDPRLGQFKTLLYTLFGLIGGGIVLIVFGYGAEREKQKG